MKNLVFVISMISGALFFLDRFTNDSAPVNQSAALARLGNESSQPASEKLAVSDGRLRKNVPNTQPSGLVFNVGDIPAEDDKLLELAMLPEYGYWLWLMLKKCEKTSDEAPSEENNAKENVLAGACLRIDNAIGDRSEEMIRRAAEAGVVQAQMDYVNYTVFDAGNLDSVILEPEQIPAEDKKLALGFLNAAANSGAVEAMIMLAGVYDANVLTPANSVLSYAWDYAAHLTGLANNSDVLLDERETNLTPEQLRDARRLGESLYLACCRHK
ncbi:hypothetical protein [Comamonas piscis]